MKQSNPAFFRTSSEGIRKAVTGEVIKDMSIFCTHDFEGGHRCASPALRGQPTCYHHQPSRLNRPTGSEVRQAERRARQAFPLPRPTTQHETQQALRVVLHAIAANRVTPDRGGRLLHALQQLLTSLPETSSPQAATECVSLQHLNNSKGASWPARQY